MGLFGRLSVDAEFVSDQIRALEIWDREANLPDVLQRADHRAFPGLVARVISNRETDRRGPEPMLNLPYPKDDGTHRITCLLDPYDDLRFALLASRVARRAEAALPTPSVVLSTRFVPYGRAYGAEDWRAAKVRQRLNIHQRLGSCVGGLDVSNYFASIRMDTIRRILNSCLVPQAQVEAVVALLEGFAAWPTSPSGLPAGPMGSALFGTLALLPIDRLLSKLGVVYERWVDDFMLEASSEWEFREVRDAVAQGLACNGQMLNSKKEWFKEPTADFDQSLGEPDRLDAAVDPMAHLAVDALTDAINSRDSRRCRFILGRLRARRDTRGCLLVVSSDVLWTIAPRQAGNYLVACRDALEPEHLEELGERCSKDPTVETAAGIAHGARVLGKRRVPGQMGAKLYDAAERISTGPHRATAPFLYYGASISSEKPKVRQERSIDTASAVHDLPSVRALIAGLRYDTRPKVVDSGLRALAKCREELLPTVAWVEAH